MTYTLSELREQRDELWADIDDIVEQILRTKDEALKKYLRRRRRALLKQVYRINVEIDCIKVDEWYDNHPDDD